MTSVTFPAHKLEDSLSFRGTPAGTYAKAVFQDINSDEKLNSNFYGAPTEPYGFSNNIFGLFGPPKFVDAAFDVQVNDTVGLSMNLE